MNSFDIFVIIILGASVAYSAFRGLIREIFSLLSIAAGYLVALNFQDNVAEWLSDTIENDTLNHLLAYSILFALAYLSVFFLGKLAKKYIQKWEAVTRADRIWGGVLGLFKGILIVVITLFPLQFFENTYENLTEDSFMRPHLEDMTAFLGDNIDVQREYLEDFQNMDLKGKIEDLEDGLEDKLENGMDGIHELEENLENRVEEGQEALQDLKDKSEKIQEEVTSQDRKKLEDMLRKMDKK